MASLIPAALVPSSTPSAALSHLPYMFAQLNKHMIQSKRFPKSVEFQQWLKKAQKTTWSVSGLPWRKHEWAFCLLENNSSCCICSPLWNEASNTLATHRHNCLMRHTYPALATFIWEENQRTGTSPTFVCSSNQKIQSFQHMHLLYLESFIKHLHWGLTI